jgi:hypothetical protein
MPVIGMVEISPTAAAHVLVSFPPLTSAPRSGSGKFQRAADQPRRLCAPSSRGTKVPLRFERGHAIETNRPSISNRNSRWHLEAYSSPSQITLVGYAQSGTRQLKSRNIARARIDLRLYC